MQTNWTLQVAKNKFSHVVNCALSDGPQYVTRRGVETVVVISVKDYEALASSEPSFTDFLLSCPKLDGEDPFARRKEYAKGADL